MNETVALTPLVDKYSNFSGSSSLFSLTAFFCRLPCAIYLPVLKELPFIQDWTMMLTPKVLALLALFSVSAVLAAPVAGDSLVEKRDAEPADYGNYGNYGKYGAYGDCLGFKGLKTY